MEYFDFEDIKGIERFKLGSHKALIRTLEDLYGATVSLVFNPQETFKSRWGINICESPKRESYRIVGNGGTGTCSATIGVG